MKVHQAYRFELDPNDAAAASLASHCGAARVAYNWGLCRIKADMDARREHPDHVGTGWSMPSLRKEWNRVKSQVAPWWAENSKEAYASGLQALADALANWLSERKKAKAEGRKPRVGFPTFHGKRHHKSCRFTTGSLGVVDARHVKLPVVGLVRTKERTRKLLRHIDRATAAVQSATVSCTGGRWFVAFGCEVERRDMAPTRPDAAVGVDVGVKRLAVAVDSDGVMRSYDNPRALQASLTHLRRWSRRASRREKASHGQREAFAKMARCHARVANQRRDAWHKVTTDLARAYGTVVVEHLNASGMVRNRRLARHIADAGLGMCRQQLAYKTAWRGSRLAVAEVFYPSSKTCSQCGAVKAKLPLGERVFRCECGLVMDRDENAARNILQLVTRSSPGTVNVRGLERKTPPGEQSRRPRNPWKKRKVASGHSSQQEVAC